MVRGGISNPDVIRSENSDRRRKRCDRIKGKFDSREVFGYACRYSSGVRQVHVPAGSPGNHSLRVGSPPAGVPVGTVLDGGDRGPGLLRAPRFLVRSVLESFVQKDRPSGSGRRAAAGCSAAGCRRCRGQVVPRNDDLADTAASAGAVVVAAARPAAAGLEPALAVCPGIGPAAVASSAGATRSARRVDAVGACTTIA